MSLHIPRRTYSDLYGPTTGDRVRLADTELIIEVEQDFTIYGDEITFGGGKVIRDGMGQSSQATREGQHGAYHITPFPSWNSSSVSPLSSKNVMSCKQRLIFFMVLESIS